MRCSAAPPLLCCRQPKLSTTITHRNQFKQTRSPISLTSHLSCKHNLRISSFLQQLPLLPYLSSSGTWNCIIVKAKSETDAQSFLRNAEKLAVSVVCSLLFLGGFVNRRAFASVGAPKTNASPPLDEKGETQIGKDEDEGLYLKILDKNPRDVDALKVLLYGKMKKGKTKEAVKYVERLIDIEPDEVEWRLLQALSYDLMGHLSKAKRLFKEILEERPLLLRALHGLALVMHKNREGQAVFEMLNNALEIAQGEKRITEERNIKILIAQMHVVKGDLEEGLKRYQDLVTEDPRDFRPYLCQGIIYSLLDKKKEAEEQFANYRSFVPQEFPQRGFLDDIILAAKTESREQLQKEFDEEFSNK